MSMPSVAKKNLKQITILGAGAIGQLIYHQLANALSIQGEQTSIRPSDRLNFISRDAKSTILPLSFTAYNKLQITRDAKFIGQADYDKSLADTELLIVCVKAYQVTSALNVVLPRLSKSAHILLLHNGMGPHIEVAPTLAGRGLSLGTTSQGALRLDKWHVKQTGIGLTQLGPYRATELNQVQAASINPKLKTLLLNAIPQSDWYDEILPLLWQKLAVNVTINPLTAIYNCTNGELANPKYHDIIYNAVDELVNVAAADGIDLEFSHLIERVYQVIELTAQNFSSMHQDISQQRPTEISAINGFVVTRAKAHNMNTPYNLSLVEQVRHLEAGFS
ncbi:ketopantoate reductase family protein [Shewanella sp. 125m-7]